jgi:hypothetical protein
MDVEHAQIGVIAAVRLGGNNARLERFWDIAENDFSKQLKFRRAIFSLYYTVCVYITLPILCRYVPLEPP